MTTVHFSVQGLGCTHLKGQSIKQLNLFLTWPKQQRTTSRLEGAQIKGKTVGGATEQVHC